MYLVKTKDRSQTAFEFVMSCEYFNDADEKTHETNLLISLDEQNRPNFFENQSEVVTAA
tara:strand:- start:260 stop:436 length:177 start_codon:yes stop_codon:yes gene_type:complete